MPYQGLSILIWSVVVFLCSWLTAHILVKKDRALARAASAGVRPDPVPWRLLS